MTVDIRLAADTALLADAGEGHEEHHDTASIVTLGFWIYLMSDCVLFAALFATFTVLRGDTAGGPTGREIFSLPNVAIETACLLVSSFTYGMAMIAAERNRKSEVLRWLGLTLLLGLAFLGLEIREFADLVHQGFGPERSGFLSGFFTLVGTHGFHVFSGIIWMLVLMAHVAYRGLTPDNRTRLMCLSLFWHFLDIIWIGVFTIVYLLGAA
ncbi:MAG TPA: cytochrome o ubiquinol oxidase subunit III [Acetobacteraceae bacterium]|nr:cytochrome o ubiquinol oxidase subunit III [Acetobacteraceae bacterium]